MAKRGSLTIIGSGIKSLAHITLEAQGWIKRADKVLYRVPDPATEIWIERLNPNAENLSVFYEESRLCTNIYDTIAGRILECVREGLDVCVVFYGHAGVCVNASHMAIKRAREEGYRAQMLPGVSALDCLFADLGIDPLHPGCQVLHATDFLTRGRGLQTDLHVVLYQVGYIGAPTWTDKNYTPRHLDDLADALQRYYDGDYEVILYQASDFPICPPVIERLPVSEIARGRVNGASTLYIPPKDEREADAEVAERLGLAEAPRSESGPSKEAQLRTEARRPAIRPTGRAYAMARFVEDACLVPRLLEQFFREPEATLDNYIGLSGEGRAALLSKDSIRIHTAMRREPDELGEIMREQLMATLASLSDARPSKSE